MRKFFVLFLFLSVLSEFSHERKCHSLGSWEDDSMMELCIPCSMVIKESPWDQPLTKMGEKLGLSRGSG